MVTQKSLLYVEDRWGSTDKFSNTKSVCGIVTLFLYASKVSVFDLFFSCTHKKLFRPKDETKSETLDWMTLQTLTPKCNLKQIHVVPLMVASYTVKLLITN